MANKMTYKVFYQNVINAGLSDEMTAFAQNALQTLENKAKARAEKGTKTQRDNAIIKANIVKAMEADTVYTVASIITMGIEGVTSTQKASALLRQLKDEGVVTESEVKVKGKGKVKGYTLVLPEGVIAEDILSEE